MPDVISADRIGQITVEVLKNDGDFPYSVEVRGGKLDGYREKHRLLLSALTGKDRIVLKLKKQEGGRQLYQRWSEIKAKKQAQLLKRKKFFRY